MTNTTSTFCASSFMKNLLEPKKPKPQLEILNRNSPYKHYVLGRNVHALSTLEHLRIDGVIDDFAPADSLWEGLPVQAIDQLDPKNSLALNCSLSIYPISAQKKLTNHLGKQVISFGELLRAKTDFPLPDFIAEMRESFRQNGKRWEWLYNTLEDEESKKTLLKILGFRLTGDLEHMYDFSVKFSDQYFDPIVQTTSNEIYVDCGGFDGDTALEFSKRYPHYKKIFVFEPSTANFTKAKTQLSHLERCQIEAIGISDRHDILYFDAHSASASAVNQAGSTQITVDTLDSLVEDKTTFIKMDIEGWELPALKGATQHILRDHPKLAIAAYHKTNDFLDIPEFILGLRSDYRIYLRHYSEGWSESVLYFIPS